MPKTFSGFTKNTTQRLVLDAGAFYKNYDAANDTPAAATAAGKLLGATRGGGEFKAVPQIRQIQVDGVKGYARGMIRVDAWDVTLMANVLEVSEKTFCDALGASVMTDENEFFKIQGKNFMEDGDYIDNITWVGSHSGSNDPVVIQIYNAVSTTGIDLKTQDKNEAVLAVTFRATLDVTGTADLDLAPFAIYYPKTVAIPTVHPVKAGDTEVTGAGLAGATVTVTGGSLPSAGVTATVDTGQTWTAAIPAQAIGAVLLVTQTIGGRTSLPVRVTVKIE